MFVFDCIGLNPAQCGFKSKDEMFLSELCCLSADVHSDDRDVPGGLVSVLHGVSVGVFWRP